MSFVLKHNFTCVCIAVPRSLSCCNAQSAAHGLHMGAHHDQRLEGHVGPGSPAGRRKLIHGRFSSNSTLQCHSYRAALSVSTSDIILHTCIQASFMARARTMSNNCSGCGSSELALRFIRVAWAELGFNLTMMSISSCAQGSDYNLCT